MTPDDAPSPIAPTWPDDVPEDDSAEPDDAGVEHTATRHEVGE